MSISVIIPSRPRTDGVLERCLGSLRDQLGPDDEVIVSIDGPDLPASAGLFPEVQFLTGPKVGPGGARNRGIDLARGDLILFLNDDVEADPGLLDAHRAAHASGSVRMVLGSAPWAVPTDDRVIDRLLRETSLIFFYNKMDDADPERDWGFRHAWTLNLSLPKAIVSRFDARLEQPMFDDLEWASRVRGATGAPVIYRPAARVTHHHRYTPGALLRREALLGHQAARLHSVNPTCAGSVFGDRYAPEIDEVGRHEESLGTGLEAARRAFADLNAVADAPSAAVDRWGIGRLFETCRVWRDAARSIGYLGFVNRQDAAGVQDEALTKLGGGIGRRPLFAHGAEALRSAS